MAKSLKRSNGSRKSLRKGRKSLKGGKKSLKGGKRTRKNIKKMHGGTPLTDLLIYTENKTFTKEEVDKFNEYINENLINAPDDSEEKLTPLHILCSQKTLRTDIIRFFIDNGADINAKTTSGNTPLDILMQNNDSYTWKSYKPFNQIMTLLLEKGGVYDDSKLVENKRNYITSLNQKIVDERNQQKESLKIGENETINPLHTEL